MRALIYWVNKIMYSWLNDVFVECATNAPLRTRSVRKGVLVNVHLR